MRTAHLIDARALLFIGHDLLWTGPIHNEQALRSLEQHCLKACVPLKVMWSQADLIAADTVLRLASERSEYCWGGKRGYSVQVARVRPVNQAQPDIRPASRPCETESPKVPIGGDTEQQSRGWASNNTGAGDAACESPAAEPNSTPAPGLISWFLWLIGVTR